KSCPASSNKSSQAKTASYVFDLVRLITADAKLLNTVYQEVMKKAFSFEYEEKFCENGSSRFCINLT
ncbi:hypothetical protein HMPREF1362_02675, partial [Enterococcus faecium ERV102]|uniref:hypothetical protein n=1 Tax=Enterococcus faecium TaxID=1352 RepID=UPI0002829BDC